MTNLFPRGLAKQRKVDESEAAPVAQKPEKAKPDIPVPLFERTKTGEETPADDPSLHEPAGDDIAVPMISPQPVLQTPKTPTAKDDILTGAGYQIPSHVLTRHSGEAKEKSPERIDFDFPSLEKMSTDDLHAGYLNRLNTSHNMERKLVNLMKSKFEVLFSLPLPLYAYVAPKSRLGRSLVSRVFQILPCPHCINFRIPVAPKGRVNMNVEPVLIMNRIDPTVAPKSGL